MERTEQVVAQGAVESGVSKHYSSYDALARIRDGLKAMGLDPDNI